MSSREMSEQIAHNIEAKSRTEDIRTSDNVDFTAMLLSEPVLQGLQRNGFRKPSPVQLKAIPMGRCGFDLIIKAKSGTGKTAVFGIVALEMVDVGSDELQVLILAPTREIAVQIQQVLLTIGVGLAGLKVEYFIGGTPVEEDAAKLTGCHIAVGAPGRVKHLVKMNVLRLDTVQLFVLDEADKLMQPGYQADINYVYNRLGAKRQLIAASATYPDALDTFLARYMAAPVHVCPDSEVPVLLGIKQFAAVVDAHHNVIQQMAVKTAELVRIFRTVSFAQCIVFCNYQTRAASLANNLVRLGWPAIHVSAAQSQEDRLAAVHSLRAFHCRILSTTDLTARGIDAAHVDLVVNYEVPGNADTYLHRMGRAGRYGAHGICVTIAARGPELERLQWLVGQIGGGGVARYPRTEDLPEDIWQCDVRDFEQLGGEGPDPEHICDPMQELSVGRPATSLDRITRVLAHEQDAEAGLGAVVGTVLDELHATQERARAELKQRLGNPDASALLATLAGTVCAAHEQRSKESSVTEQTGAVEGTGTVKKCRRKRTRNKQQRGAEDTLPNAQFESEAKSFQETNVLHKNLALYKLTALLVDGQQSVDEDCVASVGELLSILQRPEESGDRGDTPLPAALAAMLHSKPALTVETSQEAEAASEQQGTTIKCGCSEDLFSEAYACAVSQTAAHWRTALCPNHLNTGDNCNDDNGEGEEDETSADYGEEWDCVQAGEQPYLGEASTGYRQEEPDEDIFVKAYDYALNSEAEDPPQCDDTGELASGSMDPSEALGYASGYSYKNFSFRNRHKRKHTDYERKLVECVQDSSYRNTDYASHYDYYDKMLTQSAPHFNDVQSFERFFKQWQENVYAVRNFVQEDVYTTEMLRRSK